MAHGWISKELAGAGNQAWSWSTMGGVLTVIAATGFTPMQGGFGNRIIPGAGLPSTMAAGRCIPAVVGFGPLIQFGAPPGLFGEARATTAAGRLCRLTLFLMWRSAGVSMVCVSESISISVCG